MEVKYCIITKKFNKQARESGKSRKEQLASAEVEFREFLNQIKNEFPEVKILEEYPFIIAMYVSIPLSNFNEIINNLERKGYIVAENQPVKLLN